RNSASSPMRAWPPGAEWLAVEGHLAADYKRVRFAPWSFRAERITRRPGGHKTRPEDFSPAVTRAGAELPLDLEKPVVLGEPLGAGERADFDLAGASCHRQVRDEAVLGLTRPGADDGAVTVFLRELDDFQGLGERPNLV